MIILLQRNFCTLKDYDAIENSPRQKQKCTTEVESSAINFLQARQEFHFLTRKYLLAIKRDATTSLWILLNQRQRNGFQEKRGEMPGHPLTQIIFNLETDNL